MINYHTTCIGTMTCICFDRNVNHYDYVIHYTCSYDMFVTNGHVGTFKAKIYYFIKVIFWWNQEGLQ